MSRIYRAEHFFESKSPRHYVLNSQNKVFIFFPISASFLKILNISLCVNLSSLCSIMYKFVKFRFVSLRFFFFFFLFRLRKFVKSFFLFFCRCPFLKPKTKWYPVLVDDSNRNIKSLVTFSLTSSTVNVSYLSKIFRNSSDTILLMLNQKQQRGLTSFYVIELPVPFSLTTCKLKWRHK